MKTKYTIISLSSCLFISIIGLQNSRPLFNNKLILEYGTTYKLDKKDFFNTKDQDLLDSATIIFNDLNYEEDKPYPSVGLYNITYDYIYKDQPIQSSALITVKDTTKPNFTKHQNYIQVLVNYHIDFHSLFEVEDLNPVTLIIDDSKVNLSQVGAYTLTVLGIDLYGNTNKLKVTVEVLPITQDNLNACYLDIKQPTFVDDILVVNKDLPLPCNYNPGENPTAKANLINLIKDMQKKSLPISNSYSGFRSYQRQANLFYKYYQQSGFTADTFSARPGKSEHQTGLAFDLIDSRTNDLLRESKSIKWLEDNAHLYGFIIRYPKDKESITGYMYEPWHLRYIGDKASDIYHCGLTLEEYLNIK